MKKRFIIFGVELSVITILLLTFTPPVHAAACSFPIAESQDTLQNDASEKGLLIGAAGGGSTAYYNLAVREFSVFVLPGWMCGMETTKGVIDTSSYQGALNAYAGKKLKMVDLVDRTCNPSWLASDPTIDQDMHTFWDKIFALDNPNVSEYEVINEDLQNDGDKNFSYSTAPPYTTALGELQAFVEAYQYARQKVPGKLLTLNDTLPGEGVVTFASNLKAYGVPIDVISIEMHIGLLSPEDMNKMAGYMDTFMSAAEAAGFKVEISEADAPSDGSVSQNNQQAADYGQLVATCLRHSNCFEVIFWSSYDGVTNYQKNSSLFDANLNRKPAYYGVMDAIRNDTTRACVNITPTPAPTPQKPGDLNGDGKVDINDYNLLLSKFGNPYTIFDYNNLVGNFGK